MNLIKSDRFEKVLVNLIDLMKSFDKFPMFFECFLTFWHKKIFYVYLIHSLQNSVSQEIPVPLVGEWHLEPKVCLLLVLVTTGMPFLL